MKGRRADEAEVGRLGGHRERGQARLRGQAVAVGHTVVVRDQIHLPRDAVVVGQARRGPRAAVLDRRGLSPGQREGLVHVVVPHVAQPGATGQLAASGKAHLDGGDLHDAEPATRHQQPQVVGAPVRVGELDRALAVRRAHDERGRPGVTRRRPEDAGRETEAREWAAGVLAHGSLPALLEGLRVAARRRAPTTRRTRHIGLCVYPSVRRPDSPRIEASSREACSAVKV